MADKPILFSSPMVRALIDGRKTQTRRLAKITTVMGAEAPLTCPEESLIELEPGEFRSGIFHYLSTGALSGPYRLRYAVGDRLWVRESFVTGWNIDDEYGRPIGERQTWYRATEHHLSWYDPDSESTLDNPLWKPSIHMPRWASRLTLIVTDVRVQRLQDITVDDALAEGVQETGVYLDMPRMAFRALWDSLHKTYAWDYNPWVCALTFDVRRCNIDRMEDV